MRGQTAGSASRAAVQQPDSTTPGAAVGAVRVMRGAVSGMAFGGVIKVVDGRLRLRPSILTPKAWRSFDLDGPGLGAKSAGKQEPP